MEMNILFSSDDNYAQHLGVAMFSLLKNNQQSETIRVFVVNNHISEENIQKLHTIANSFSNCRLSFLSFEDWKPLLQLKMAWPISISAYARLFVAEMLPLELDRILYLDCDMVVLSDLSDLWNFDLQGNCLGAVQDQVFPRIKTAVGLDSIIPYFNSGLLLIDLHQWRHLKIGAKCIQFINQHEGKVIHHDQGVLNGVLSNQWICLPLRYNVMTIHYFFSQKRIVRYFKDYCRFYNSDEIEMAKENPSIIHFTPSFTPHPWEKGCKHPKCSIYLESLEETPWKNENLSQSSSPWYIKLLNWWYRNIDK